jgi:hypothetical protein
MNNTNTLKEFLEKQDKEFESGVGSYRVLEGVVPKKVS